MTTHYENQSILCIPITWVVGSTHFEVSPGFPGPIPLKTTVALVGNGRLIVGHTNGAVLIRPAHIDIQIVGVTDKSRRVEVVLRVENPKLPSTIANTASYCTQLLGGTPRDYALLLPGTHIISATTCQETHSSHVAYACTPCDLRLAVPYYPQDMERQLYFRGTFGTIREMWSCLYQIIEMDFNKFQSSRIPDFPIDFEYSDYAFVP